ncbi:MAG TPA: hypothetical protein VFN97_10125 [Actinospica sp.]|nr:hypothetical protein [Actinospica sp.]
MVEGISELSEGVLLGERYRLVRRLEIFAAEGERVAGVEYEYWLALDVTSETEVWVQFAAADGVYASGAELAGAVTALRRINHPAVPAVHAFGEYEFEVDGAVTTVGYCAMPALEGETLAAALLREELDQAEILAALAQVAEVLELLAEFELVHGHLSAHSVLLIATENAGYQVVLADLPASLAVQTAAESELSVAADVYALAWLTVLALIGVAVLEAEFGAGFAVTADFELLAEEVVQRRGAWAAENLVVLGVSEALAGVLLPALGEAAGRPRASALTGALRAEWMLLATGAEATAVEAAAAEAVVAEEVAVEEVAVEEVVAEEVVAEEVVAEEVVAAEVVEATEKNSAEKKSKKSGAAKGAAAAAVAGAVVAVEIAGAGSAQAAQGAGAGAGAGAGSGAGAVLGAGEVTETIPRVPRAPRPKSGAGAGASASSAAAVGAVGFAGGSSSAEHRGQRKPKTGLLIGAGVGLVVVIALVITITSGSSNKSNTASSGSIGTPAASATHSAGATTGAGAGGAGSAAASSGASSSAGSSTATTVAGTETFPATLSTIPSSAGQAVHEIQTVVNQARGELTSTQQAQLTQVISTLTQEIGSGQSISTGMTQFWALLHSNELPTSLNTYLTQYAEYLSASQGS